MIKRRLKSRLTSVLLLDKEWKFAYKIGKAVFPAKMSTNIMKIIG
jgi:hypothetical protein